MVAEISLARGRRRRMSVPSPLESSREPVYGPQPKKAAAPEHKMCPEAARTTQKPYGNVHFWAFVPLQS